MTDSIHSCGYHCERPNCVKRQRDELVRKYVVEQEAPELSDDEERKAFEAAYLEHIDPDAVFDRYDFTKSQARSQTRCGIARTGRHRSGT